MFVTPLPAVMSCPRGSAAKESACNAGDLGSIPGFRGSPEEGNVYPLQYSGHGEVHGVAELDMTGRLSLLSPLWWETRKGWVGAESVQEVIEVQVGQESAKRLHWDEEP